MPGKQQIEFVIRPDGTVEERVTGVNGPQCEQATDAIERALGRVEERKHTPEYYNQADSASDSVVTKS